MQRLNKFELTKDLYLFCRQLAFKLLYHQPSLLDSIPDEDRQTFRDLLDLLNENSTEQDPTKIFKDKIDRLLLAALRAGILNKTEADFLTTQKPIIPTFYLLPKVHKSLVKPPGRPIVSGMGSLNEKLCTYLDFFLQPLVSKLTSFVRDTTHLIQRINDFRTENPILLVTLDVESLYTIIEHQGLL
ncbi:uncharacterized protein [Engystomops pustulosus]|uniref:uncharacterized protein isoform X2 n=1 Tax=Engystomops pustulosus TaxID=76066 RepID=UPI003AFB4B7C